LYDDIGGASGRFSGGAVTGRVKSFRREVSVDCKTIAKEGMV
jgi:hypothetical protein